MAGRNKKGKGYYSKSCIGRKFKSSRSRTVKVYILLCDSIYPCVTQNSIESVYDTLSASSLPEGWYYITVSNDEIHCFQITR